MKEELNNEKSRIDILNPEDLLSTISIKNDEVDSALG